MKQFIRYVMSLGVFALSSFHTNAQTVGNTPPLDEPMTAQYFQAPYMANAAMAGIDTGLHVTLAYRRQWSGIPGAPESKALSADYMLFKRVGIGMNIYNDKAGLLNNTKVAFTYAYHLPLSTNGASALHFGLSGAFIARRLDTQKLNGDVTDPNINAFNRRDNYFEADFGMAFTRKGLTVQAAMPNLVSAVKTRDTDVGIDRALFFAAAGYKFETGEQLSSIEPKICLRGIKGYKDIVDAGANFAFLQNQLNVFGLYHSTKSFSVGAGANYRSIAGFQVIYNSQTAGLNNYTNGAFEVNLTVNLAR
ncbi:type IX secretion system PorP/SprF family membrane protein [Chitinophaga polysaccharea]|uniref:Type IX secretion system PorP/SprF family membrane protein n=1 Tax=Chitinophaga polysaccharea TaxID=1293035 RepID=A0A561PP22_9BACT|nr:PorP/SprF family type IX secretion system membrane protein [Chitinophaga polysaccharea]TWF39866.1 type IX secretion system PorP/SprF family membrane protein [Chitinophaga polysaccharea]